jgi:hypothetical protein
MVPRRPLFRAQALQQYTWIREKAVLPRLVAPSVFFCFWLLPGQLLLETVLVWQVQVRLSLRTSRPTGVVAVLSTAHLRKRFLEHKVLRA